MAIKYVDLEYLRAQNSSAGQLIVTGNSNAVTFSSNVVVDTTGNLILSSPHIGDVGIIFPDGSIQTTAGQAGGITGSVQYNVNGSITGDADKFFIDINTGNVGIGTTSHMVPNKFSVYGGNLQVGSTGYGVIFPDGTFQTTAAYLTPPGGTNRAVQFNDNGAFGGNINQLSLDANGNVGIGTSLPLASLEVSGGNIQIKTVGYGLVFPDGSVQTSAGQAGGITGSIQYNVNGSITGDANKFFIDVTSGSIGIGTNLPLALLDVRGSTNISSNEVSISTTTGALVVAGGVGIEGELNAGGQIYSAGIINAGGAAIVNSLSVNTAIHTSTLQAAGNVLVNNLSSNGVVNTSTILASDATITNLTVENIQVDQSLMAPSITVDNLTVLENAYTANLISTGPISGTIGTFDNLQSSGSIIGQTILSNTSISGTTITGTDATFTSLQSSGPTTVNLLTSNGTISGTVITGSTGFEGGYVSGIVFNASGSATVNSLVSNSTISGTSGTFTSIQSSGSATVNSLTSNVYGVFGQNVTINSGNSSISTTTGALVIAGGVGIGENINAGGQIATTGMLNVGSTAIVNNLISNTSVSGNQAGFNHLSVQYEIIGGSLNSNSTIQSIGAAVFNHVTSNTGIEVNSGGINIVGASQFTGNVSIAGNLILSSGNIIISQANVLVVQDPIIYVGENNPGNTWDLGIVGSYTTDHYQHTGFVRNHIDGVWTLFDNLTTEPETTIDWSQDQLKFGEFKAGNIFVASNQPSVSSVTGALIITGTGGVGVGGAINSSGQIATTAGVNAGNYLIAGTVTSNGSISGTNGYFTSIHDSGIAVVQSLVSNTLVNAATLQIASSAIVNSLISNTSIAGNTGNFVSLQIADGLLTNTLTSNTYINTNTLKVSSTGLLNDIVANTNIFSATLNTSGLAQHQSIISNTSINTVSFVASGTAIVANLISNNYIHTNTLQTDDSATVNSLVSNTTISGTTITGSTGFEGGYVSGTVFNARNTAIVNELISNTSISGTDTHVTSLHSSGTATVNQLVSNTSISGTTINGTDVTINTLQASGIITVNQVNSNGSVNGTNFTGSGSGTFDSITSNTVINSQSAVFDNLQVNNRTTTNSLITNVFANFGQNVVIQSGNASVDPTTGAVVVTGGVGLGGNINAGGSIHTLQGNVGIQTMFPSTALHVAGDVTVDANLIVTNTVFATHFDNVSDASLKENVEPITDPMSILDQLNPVSFDWIKDGTKSYGLIAQEVERILPAIVHLREDGIKTVSYLEIISFLISAIKEQQVQINRINNKLNQLPSNPTEVEDGE
jgi:hypothetical protein